MGGGLGDSRREQPFQRRWNFPQLRRGVRSREHIWISSGVRDAGNVVYVSVAQPFADVAKLADALGLGSSSRKGVGVQVPSSAPIRK
jgi:hypothetical protein